MSPRRKRWSRNPRCSEARHTFPAVSKGQKRLSRGLANEKKFVDGYRAAKNAGRLPSWFHSAKKGSEKDDHHGIDAWAITDAGPIPIQIKSSNMGCKKFLARKRKRYIPCFAMRDSESLETMVNRTLPDIERERNNLFELRQRILRRKMRELSKTQGKNH